MCGFRADEYGQVCIALGFQPACRAFPPLDRRVGLLEIFDLRWIDNFEMLPKGLRVKSGVEPPPSFTAILRVHMFQC